MYGLSMNISASPNELPGPDDLDDLLAALRGDERQLHLAVDHQVEAGAGVALVEQDLAARDVQLGGARRRCGRSRPARAP